MPPSDYEPLVAPKEPPPLHIPPGSTVSVKIIDSTTTLKLPLSLLMGPKIHGHDNLFCPAYSFLIEHSSGRKLLFDLGTRKDLENLPPSIVEMIAQPQWEFKVEKDVAEILQEDGVALGNIEGVIWSHWHFDHTGNMKTFPPDVKLIVGPGFKKNLLPGYPLNPESHLLESDWEGRELIEIEFDSGIKVGRYKAFDYFHDGSFYLLDAPGHAIGHMCGLARVSGSSSTEEDTFVFMGADTCHHGGEWKPNEYLPLPAEVSLVKTTIRGRSICPGSLFQSLHHDNSTTIPYYRMGANYPQVYDEAEESIHGMQEFDAAGNVLVIIAHDTGPLDSRSGFKMFPGGTLNNWKGEGLKKKLRWMFLDDFSAAIEEGKQQETTMGEGHGLRV